MNYLVVGLALVACGNAFGGEQEEVKRKIERMHSATTAEELHAAERDGVLHAYSIIRRLACPLVIKHSLITRKTFLLDSILKNPNAGAELIDVCASKGITSGIGVIIEFDNGVFPQREIPLLCELMAWGNTSAVKEHQLNPLSQLRDKCKKIVTFIDSPLSCKGTTEKSEVHVFVSLAERHLSSAYQYFGYGQSMEPLRRIKYTLTMCKAIDQACDEQYRGLDTLLADALHKFPMCLVKMVRQYRVTDEELAEAAKLKHLLADPQAQPYLAELESEV